MASSFHSHQHVTLDPWGRFKLKVLRCFEKSCPSRAGSQAKPILIQLLFDVIPFYFVLCTCNVLSSIFVVTFKSVPFFWSEHRMSEAVTHFDNSGGLILKRDSPPLQVCSLIHLITVSSGVCGGAHCGWLTSSSPGPCPHVLSYQLKHAVKGHQKHVKLTAGSHRLRKRCAMKMALEPESFRSHQTHSISPRWSTSVSVCVFISLALYLSLLANI